MPCGNYVSREADAAGAVSRPFNQGETMAPSNQDLRIGIYGTGLFQDHYPDPTPSYQEQLTAIANGGYTTVVLWALHVHSTGDFYYNDNLMVQNGVISTSSDPNAKRLNPDFVALVKQLATTGSVREILLSIGPFQSDFQAIVDNLDVAQRNFAALFAAMPITAVDFDYEPTDGPFDVDMIVDLTTMLDGLGVGTTYCPYTDQGSWSQCLTGVYSKAGRQLVRWFNLQCYDGGYGNDPTQWASAIAQAGETGIADPASFVLPGYWVAHTGDKTLYNTCPAQLRSILSGFAPKGVTGAWVWNSGDIFTNEGVASLCGGAAKTPGDYAQAMIAGLGG